MLFRIVSVSIFGFLRYKEKKYLALRTVLKKFFNLKISNKHLFLACLTSYSIGISKVML